MHISKSDRGCLNDNKKSKALKANFKLTLFSYYGHLFFLRYLTKSIQQQQEQREKYNSNSNSDLFLQWFLQISISFSKDSRCYAKELFLKYNPNFERHCKIHLLVYIWWHICKLIPSRYTTCCSLFPTLRSYNYSFHKIWICSPIYE